MQFGYTTRHERRRTRWHIYLWEMTAGDTTQNESDVLLGGEHI